MQRRGSWHRHTTATTDHGLELVFSQRKGVARDKCCSPQIQLIPLPGILRKAWDITLLHEWQHNRCVMLLHLRADACAQPHMWLNSTPFAVSNETEHAISQGDSNGCKRQHVTRVQCIVDSIVSQSMALSTPSGAFAQLTWVGDSIWQPGIPHLPSSLSASEVLRKGCSSFLVQYIGMPLTSLGRKFRYSNQLHMNRSLDTSVAHKRDIGL